MFASLTHDTGGDVLVNGLEDEVQVCGFLVETAEYLEDTVSHRERLCDVEGVCRVDGTTAGKDHGHGVAVTGSQGLQQMHHGLVVAQH